MRELAGAGILAGGCVAVHWVDLLVTRLIAAKERKSMDDLHTRTTGILQTQDSGSSEERSFTQGVVWGRMEHRLALNEEDSASSASSREEAVDGQQPLPPPDPAAPDAEEQPAPGREAHGQEGQNARPRAAPVRGNDAQQVLPMRLLLSYLKHPQVARFLSSVRTDTKG